MNSLELPHRFAWQSAILVVWAVVVAYITYNLRDPQAWLAIRQDSGHYAAVLTTIPRGLPHLAVLLWLLLSAMGSGYFVSTLFRLGWRDEVERTFVSIALGLILLTFMTLLIGELDLLQTSVVIPLLCLATAATAVSVAKSYMRAYRAGEFAWFSRRVFLDRWRTRRLIPALALALLLVVYLYTALLGALGPEVQYDARLYHLGPPVHYVEAERLYDIVKQTHLARAAWPAYQETLYTLLTLLSGPIAAKLLHWADGAMGAMFLLYFCRLHFGSALMGLVAGLIFISTPVVTWSMSTANNELAVALYTLLSIHAALRWRETPRRRGWLALAGVFAGYAVGVKLIGGYSLAILLIFVMAVPWLERSEDTRSVLRRSLTAGSTFGLFALLCCVPWFGRSYSLTGNPVFPLLNGVFKSPYWNRFADVTATNAYQYLGQNHSLWALLSFPWVSVTNSTQYRGLVGPIFLLATPMCAGLALFARGSRTDLFRLLAAYVVLWTCVWWASGALDTRFTETIMPIASMLVAFILVVKQWPGRQGAFFRSSLWCLFGLAIVLNNQLLLPLQRNWSSPYVAGHAYFAWNYLFGDEPEDEVQLSSVPMLRYINRHLNPCSDKAYDGTDLMLYYMYSRVELFNGEQYDGPTGLRQWSLQSANAFLHLKHEHITHVAVYADSVPGLKQTGLWAHLQKVHYSSIDRELLLRVRYHDLGHWLTGFRNCTTQADSAP